MTSSRIRQSFLDYFAGQGHRIVRSSSLVPADDPTLLFTNAGMNQFKDLFLGRERRDYRRATTSQKCMRVSGKHNDLDNVGPSRRHHTFFEMLGNFSFGDYFKDDAIPFAWTLLTDVWRLPPDRLHPTVFKGEGGIPRDDEAHAIWSRLVPSERIVEMGLEDNFWAMGDTGPCGRCSEVHYHRGDHVPCDEPACRGIDCSCERYVEIWNNVFMEFDRDAGGKLTPLPAASIDTGMGLERIVAIIQEKTSNYDTDLFSPLLRAIGDQTGRVYGPLAPGGRARARRRLDAGRRRPPARHDLPDRRRGHALQRVARLRAPQDHAPRDAAREEAGDDEPVPASPRRRRGPRDGRRVSRASRRAGDHHRRGPGRGGPIRRGPDRRPPPPRGGADPFRRRRPGRGGDLPPVRHLRTAPRFHRGAGRRAQRGRRPRRLRAAPRGPADAVARGHAVLGGRRVGRVHVCDRHSQRSGCPRGQDGLVGRPRPGPVRGVHGHAPRRGGDPGTVQRRAHRGSRTRPRSVRLRGPRSDAVLSRGRRTGLGHRKADPGRRRRRGRGRRPGAHRPRGPARPPRAGHGGGACGSAAG